MKIAVIGSGISGLSSAYLLSQANEVHLFEADSRLGGHANTVDVHEGNKAIPIDTGFLVYNKLTYPHLCGLFDHLGVDTVDSDMTLSVQVKEKNLEWSGTNINSVFGQRRNLLKPSFYRMILGILKFHRQANENLELSQRHQWSLGELLKEKKYSHEFIQDYILPIGAAIWSTPEKMMLSYPAETFLQFFINHKLLQVNERPIWRTVKNGSREYVQKIAKKLENIHLNTQVIRVEPKNGQVEIETRVLDHSKSLTPAHAKDERKIQIFDRVVLACHAPQAREMLKNADSEMHHILGNLQTQANLAVLHSDDEVMPKRKICWSAWNVLGARDYEKRNQVSLSYYMNLLQPLDTKKNYFVTLNSSRPLLGIKEISYSHPVFDRNAIEMQKRISSVQGKSGIYLAGAWTRYGFHEDGILSAVRVGEAMGLSPQWTPQYVGGVKT